MKILYNNNKLHLMCNTSLFCLSAVWQFSGLPRKHILRTFSATAALGVPNLRHPLVWSVDWMIVQSGQFAVVDPESPINIVYLTKKEYLKLVGVAESNDSKLTVLAHPYDARPRDEEIEAPKPNNKNTPPLGIIGHAIFWRGLLSRISRSYRAFLSRESKMFVASKVPMYLGGFIKRWALAVGQWAGLPLTTQAWFKDTVSIIPHLLHIYNKQGTTGLVLRLKNSALLTQQYLGKTPKTAFSYGHPVATKKGLPAWLPLGARMAIRQGHRNSIRFWLSIFHIYRIIEMPHKISVALKTIMLPPLDISPVVEGLLESYRQFLRTVFIPSIGGVREIPQDKGGIFTPVTAGPNGSPAINHVADDAAGLVMDYDANFRNDSEDGLTSDEGSSIMYCLSTVAMLVGINFDFPSVLELGRARLEAVRLQNIKATCDRERAKPIRHSRVHILGEPAGKLRPIAILDIFTQRILRPLHDDLFGVLKTLPQDGTHSQDRLFSWLKMKAGKWLGIWSSLDISAATDSIPKVLYQILIEELYGNTSDAIDLAKYSLQLMTDRDFTVTVDQSVNAPKSESEKLPETVRYGRGQPMGCLGSFALLALWNHSWVRFSGWLVTGKEIFSYGVTGDDVVICERDWSTRIGKKYVEISNYFGISISLPKSFVSANLFNFLSRTWYGGEEVSPASVREDSQVRDSSSRVQRALRLLRRDWWKADTSGWLAKAMKMFLYPSEYLLTVVSQRKGQLSGYGLRSALSFLSPSKGVLSSLGLSGVPVYGWLSAFAGSTALLARGDAVRSNRLLPPGSKKLSLYPVLLDLAKMILRRIEELGDMNREYLGMYENFLYSQKEELQVGLIGCLFLPSPADVKSEYILSGRGQSPNNKFGLDTVALNSRLGCQWWLPENIESALPLLFQWLEEFPQLQNFSDPELFAHQASIWYSRRMTGEKEFNQTERHMLSLVYLITEVHPESCHMSLDLHMVKYLESKMLNRFLGYV